MNCREYKTELIEAARTGCGIEARRHAEACPACALFLAQQQHLTALAREIATDAMTPAWLEPCLMQEYVGRRLRPRRRTFVRRGAGMMAGAIAAALLVAWLVKPDPKQAPVVVRTEAPAQVVVAATRTPKPRVRKHTQKQDTDLPFLAIPFTEPLDPGERAEVVRMEMPVAALIAAGFPVATSDTGAEASADVIIGEDGRARAVRLISISERRIER